jgi:diacylglycerol kinase family enzyme
MAAAGLQFGTRQVQVFLNPRSGSAGRREAQDIARLFEAAGCRCEVTRLEPQVDVAAVLRAWPPETIAVAAGGDGTVNAVANAVARTGNCMGVLALGTLNHFARDLGLPLRLDEAVRVIAEGAPRRVDAGEVNGRVFVNNSSLGAYPAMVMDRERLRRGGWNKWLSLAWATLRAFLRFRCLQVELTVEGELRQATTPFLFVGNNEYRMAGMQIGTREHLNKGRLFLYLAPGANRLGVLKLTLAALFGRVRQVPEFEEFCLEEFSVHVHVHGRRLRVSLDGEVRRMRGPLYYRIRPGALQVIQARAEG